MAAAPMMAAALARPLRLDVIDVRASLAEVGERAASSYERAVDAGAGAKTGRLGSPRPRFAIRRRT